MTLHPTPLSHQGREWLCAALSSALRFARNAKQTERYKEARMLGQTSYERGLEEGQRLAIKDILEDRFGPLSLPVQERLQAWPAERLPELLRLAYRVSLREMGLED